MEPAGGDASDEARGAGSVKDGSTLPGWPMMLRRELAAQYCGMSPSTFDVEVKEGRIPKPVPTTPGLFAWHRSDLEAWGEDRRSALAGVGAPAPNPWDEP